MGLLVASALLLASGFAKSLISKEENLNPADFNFGPQAALTAILFAVDKVVASSVDSRVDLQGAGVSAAGNSTGTAEPAKEPKWEFDRVGANKLIAYAVDPDGKAGTQVGAVFERSGFADWKLTELRLPADVE